MFVLVTGLILAAIGKVGRWYVDVAYSTPRDQALGNWIASWVIAGGTALVSIALFRTAFGSVHTDSEASIILFPSFYAAGILMGLLSVIIIVEAVVNLVRGLRAPTPVG